MTLELRVHLSDNGQLDDLGNGWKLDRLTEFSDESDSGALLRAISTHIGEFRTFCRSTTSVMTSRLPETAGTTLVLP